MKLFALPVLAAGIVTAGASLAAAPATAPSGATGICKDGSHASSPEKRGACRGHKGVKEWYAEDATSAPAKTAPTATAATATTAVAAPTAPTTTRKTSPPSSTAAAPGGGTGQVWGNESTKVHQCSGDRWYGKTKHGEYMSESDAKAKGFHAEHGKACA